MKTSSSGRQTVSLTATPADHRLSVKLAEENPVDECGQLVMESGHLPYDESAFEFVCRTFRTVDTNRWHAGLNEDHSGLDLLTNIPDEHKLAFLVEYVARMKNILPV